jgi:hypothetical protein
MLRTHSMLTAFALAAMLAAGCEGLGGSSSSSSRRDRERDADRDGISDRYDRRTGEDDLRRSDPRDGDVVGRDPDRRRDADDELTLSRGARVPRGVPADAVKVEEGVGDPLRYEADREGRVYVYDEDDDAVVYKGTLYRGEEFVVDPEADVLSAGGKRVGDVNLRAGHRYRLYFMRD